jgi:DNA primase small subunit
MTEEITETIKVYKPTEADMRHYYDNFLPFNLIFQWLNHSRVPNNDFTHREFAFEHQSGAYQRYNSFHDSSEFKKKVVKINPTRFEIGAIYPIEPKDRKTVAKHLMKPLAKEMVLDIDLTDYDEIRTCCKGTSICNKCWKFITLAIKVIDISIREDFGIENRIWVFSGRRGVHCWMSDSKIRYLKETNRRSFIEYLDILNVKGKNKSKKGIFGLKKPYHPHIERSLEILKNSFVEIILKEQGTWDNEENSKELAMLIPDLKLRNTLLNEWKKNPNKNSTDKWVDIGEYYKELGITSFDLVDWRKEMILQMLYPRLDVEVSRQMNHLLKSPFCVHPGTGNVCVAFDPLEKEFNPFTDAPNLNEIFTQDEFDVNKTSLATSVNIFKNYVEKLLLLEETSANKRKQQELTTEW